MISYTVRRILGALFPNTEGDFDMVYTQEKTGFAQAKLKKGGKDIALLSISDTVNNPSALYVRSNANVYRIGIAGVCHI